MVFITCAFQRLFLVCVCDLFCTREHGVYFQLHKCKLHLLGMKLLFSSSLSSIPPFYFGGDDIGRWVGSEAYAIFIV